MWKPLSLCDIQCFCDCTHQYSVLATFSPCCEKQLKTFGLSANSRRVLGPFCFQNTHRWCPYLCWKGTLNSNQPTTLFLWPKLLWQFFFKSGDSKAYIITACSELQKVPFLAQSVCDFLFVYKISREPVQWICTRFTRRRLVLVPRVDEFEGQRSRSSWTRNGIFSPFSGLHAVNNHRATSVTYPHKYGKSVMFKLLADQKTMSSDRDREILKCSDALKVRSKGRFGSYH